jgi:predicted Fe-Mo cluster-binding NifX family protein
MKIAVGSLGANALVEKSIGVVITSALTPECCQALWSFGIEVIIGREGLTVGRAVEEYKAGVLR